MNADELNAKLIVAEDALAVLSEKELIALLSQIGYSTPAIDVLREYQKFVKAFREKMNLQ